MARSSNLLTIKSIETIKLIEQTRLIWEIELIITVKTLLFLIVIVRADVKITEFK